MPNQGNEKVVYRQIRNVAIGFGILVVILWVGNLIYGQNLGHNERGLFGDMFGAVNALFSGLAFVGLIYTILLQSQELKLQREELKLTREEMQDTRVEIEGQKKALELQSETMLKQQFEQTFTTLIQSLDECVIQLKIREGYRDLEGNFQSHMIKSVEVFKILTERYKTCWDSQNSDEFKEHCKIVIEKISIDSHYSVVKYIRVFYFILQYLENSKIKDKGFYANLLLSRINVEQSYFHFYVTVNNNEMKKLIEKYGMLRDFYDLFAKFEYVPELYSKSAFMPEIQSN